MGAKPQDVAAQVADERRKHGGGPREVQDEHFAPDELAQLNKARRKAANRLCDSIDKQILRQHTMPPTEKQNP